MAGDLALVIISLRRLAVAGEGEVHQNDAGRLSPLV